MLDEITDLRANLQCDSWSVMSAASAPIPSQPTPARPLASSPCDNHAPAPTLDEDVFRKVMDQAEDVGKFANFLASSHIDDERGTLWRFWWKSGANERMAKDMFYFSHDVHKNTAGNPKLNNHFGWCCKTCHQGYYEDLYEAPERRENPDFKKDIYNKFGRFFRMPEVVQPERRQTTAIAQEVRAQELQLRALPGPMRAPVDEGMVAAEPQATQAIPTPEVQPSLETTINAREA